MTSKALKYSDVAFDESAHTYYTPSGVLLKGITGIISKYLFPQKYDGIPEHILKAAAERGTKIHDECRQADLFGIAESEEAINYLTCKKEYGITTIDNEYLVTDGEHFATMIDIVGNDFSLYDIKTTSVLDEDYLSWQLSFCAVLFEKQNPHLKAGKLYGLWLRNGKHKLVEVPRIADEHINALIEAELAGVPFVNPLQQQSDLPVDLRMQIAIASELESLVTSLKEQIKQKEKDLELVKEYLLAEMKANDVKKWTADTVTVTYIAPTERRTFDSKSFAADHPEMAKGYFKLSPVKESLKITVK